VCRDDDTLLGFVGVCDEVARRRGDTEANTAIAIAAIGVTAVVLIFCAVDTLLNDAWTFVAVVVLAVLAVVLDAIRKRPGTAAGPGPESGPLPVGATVTAIAA
jgi:peptidoglycan/LPS O-acetylase OafA/YrhL